jgi:hypothetical protein
MDKAAVDAAVAAMESSIHNIDLWALICGIAVAAFLAGEIWFIGAHWLKESTLKPLRERQAQLGEIELARLKSETATANKATEELKRQNLELEQAVAPRILEISAPEKALKDFSPQIIQLDVIPEFEARRLAGGLFGLFKTLKWDMRPPAPSNPELIMDGVRVEYTGPKRTYGPFADPHPDPEGEKREAAAQALVAELKKQNIEATAFSFPPGYGGGDGVLPDALRIHVGAKPTMYFVEQKYPWIKEQREYFEKMEAEMKQRQTEALERINKRMQEGGFPPLQTPP